MSLYRKLAYSFLCLAALVFIVLPLFLLVTINSTFLSQWLVNYSRPFLPEQIEFSRFSGRLSGPFTLEQFRYQSQPFSAEFADITLEWSPATLLSGELRIDALALGAGEIRTRPVAQQPSTEPAASLEQVSVSLPFSVTLSKLTMAESWLFINDAPQQQVALDAALNVSKSGQLMIDELFLQHQYVILDATAEASLSYPFDYSLNTDVDLHSPDYPATTLNLLSSGNLEQLSATAQIRKSAVINIKASAQNLLATPRWQAQVDIVDSQLNDWLAAVNSSGLPPLVVDGTITVANTDTALLNAEPKLSIRSPELAADVSGLLTFANNQLTVSSLTTALTGLVTGELNSSGTISLADTPTVNIGIEANQLNYEQTSTSGSLTVNGTAQQLELTGQSESRLSEEHRLTAAVKAQLTQEQLTISELEVAETTTDGRVSGSASIHWENELHVLSDITGQLFEQPLSLITDIRYASPYITVTRLQAKWQDNTLSAEGMMAPGRQLTLSATLPQLADLPLPVAIRGALDVDAIIEGDINAPWANVQITADALAIADTDIEQLDVSVEGDLNTQDVALTATTLGASWSIETQLERSATAIAADINRLVIDHESLEPLELQTNAQFMYNWQTTSLQLHNFCVTQQRLAEPACVQIHSENGLSRAEFNAPHLELAVINPLLPNSPLRVQGQSRISLDATWSWPDSELTRLSGQFNTGAIRLEGLEETITVDAVNIDIAPQRQQTRVSLKATAEEVGLNLKGELSLAALTPTAALDGSLTAALSDLSFLQLLSPAVAQADGNLQANIGITGTLRAPRLKPSAEASVNQFVLSETGTDISETELVLTAAGADNSVFDLRANGRIGDGRFQLNGRYDVPQQQLSASLSGNTLRVMNTPEVSVSVSPDVRLELADNKLTVRGNVIVPEAHITPPQLDNVTRPSSDVVIKQAEQQRQTKLETDANITVTLGDNVNVAAYGFEGQLQGRLTISQANYGVARGDGQIGVKAGTYEVYGQELSIDRGQLIYNGGPLQNPGLNLQVVRKLPEATANPKQVGARVQGTLQEPTLSLFSEPPMPDASVLSYLLFGRAPNSQSESTNLELQAALLLTGDMADAFTQSLKDTFGFDEVSIDSSTDNVNDTSLYIGKYLTPRLYIKYGIGLVESTSSFFLRYQLTDHFWIESNSSTESQSGDLIYSIEK